MNSKLLILSLGILSVVGCSSDDSPFTEGGNVSSSNIITSDHFAITSSELNPNVLTLAVPIPAAVPPAVQPSFTTCDNVFDGVVTAPVTATITVTAADKDGGLVSTGTVYFETQYGLLDQTSCTLTNGTCSVEWSSIANTSELMLGPNYCSIDSATDPISVVNTIVAWTYGAEGFIDLDGDGKLSDSEVFLDTDEPFIDNNDDGNFDIGVDSVIDVTTIDGVNNGPNSSYDGPDCDTATHPNCGSVALTPIYDIVTLKLHF